MNPTEAMVLLTYVARIDHRTFSSDDADTYADLLDDVNLAEAMHAAREHLREESAWLSPALIRRRVLDARAQQAPPWCGSCDRRTRMVEHPETGAPRRCPACNPRARKDTP